MRNNKRISESKTNCSGYIFYSFFVCLFFFFFFLLNRTVLATEFQSSSNSSMAIRSVFVPLTRVNKKRRKCVPNETISAVPLTHHANHNRWIFLGSVWCDDPTVANDLNHWDPDPWSGPFVLLTVTTPLRIPSLQWNKYHNAASLFPQLPPTDSS